MKGDRMKLEFDYEQLKTLREAFIFGVKDRGDMDDDDIAILLEIDRALYSADGICRCSACQKRSSESKHIGT
jgi:hypothetical protein